MLSVRHRPFREFLPQNAVAHGPVDKLPLHIHKVLPLGLIHGVMDKGLRVGTVQVDCPIERVLEKVLVVLKEPVAKWHYVVVNDSDSGSQAGVPCVVGVVGHQGGIYRHGFCQLRCAKQYKAPGRGLRRESGCLCLAVAPTGS